MPIQRTDAIVLRRRDFRETSLIADFYTRDFGKVSGLLKGFRVMPPKFASPIEPFSLNEIIFYPKRNSSLHLVSQADLRYSFDGIRRGVGRATMAAFMMELTLAVMQQEDRNEEVFDLALACLKEMETALNPEKVMTIFKIKMLSLSGFKPHLDSCVVCGSKILGQSRFSLSLGGLLCGKCSSKDVSSRSIFRGTVASILHIEKNDLKNNLNLGMNPEIKRELDLVLNAFMNFHLEKELKSQRVLNKLAVAV
ncbi:MAG: DNA repair protein RecO [Candidatus Omnitrophica bacterium]|nr:DNA repair protein RecO [Candidatus Omnitrophota bacterium]